jgi:hypothetical protein
MSKKRIEAIIDETGLVYCAPDYCGCGEHSLLLFTCEGTKDWVPSWMNGSCPYEVERWLKKNRPKTR